MLALSDADTRRVYTALRASGAWYQRQASSRRYIGPAYAARRAEMRAEAKAHGQLADLVQASRPEALPSTLTDGTGPAERARRLTALADVITGDAHYLARRAARPEDLDCAAAARALRQDSANLIREALNGASGDRGE